ncbi:MAG: glycosyl hydrolase 108 family protein [Candidatus Zixiibacteriota bacterium]
MAEFKTAFANTSESEGGYVHDPSDAGGETYRGVSRRYNPAWSGWEIIDAAKASQQFPKNLDDDHVLQLSVETFYRAIWIRLKGDEIASQVIADELFDAAVNPGERLAVAFLQNALNSLNKNQKLWHDQPVDGQIGPRTLSALDAASGDSALVAKVQKILRANYFIGRMMKDPRKEKYARGWLDRLEL